MNKRKPDEEFARIGLSYIGTDGTEVVVECPESRGARATQAPVRSSIQAEEDDTKSTTDAEPNAAKEGADSEAVVKEPLSEQHFTIMYGDTGHTYESLLAIVKIGIDLNLKNHIPLQQALLEFLNPFRHLAPFTGVSRVGHQSNLSNIRVLKDCLAESNEVLNLMCHADIGVFDNYRRSTTQVWSQIRIDNGWVIKIGRGLDIYQKPDGWFSVGANDLSLRQCLETKVDIFFREPSTGG